MRRALIVAYYFPPIGGIGSIRLTRFAELLPEFGWEPTVLTPRNTPHAGDPDLQFPERKVVRSASLEISRLGRAVPGAPDGGGQADRRTLHDRARRIAHRFVYYPDGQIGWYPGAVAAGLRALRRDRFDVIYSSSNPITAHLVARTLSRRAGLPWVAEFRDPWCDRLPEDHPHRRRAAALEAALAGEATKVVMPTQMWAEHYGHTWGTSVAVVPNGADAAPPGASPESPVLTHVGTFYPALQSLAPVWPALRELALGNGSAAPRLRFVGQLPDALRAELDASGVGRLVEVTGNLPYHQAQQAMAASSALIASGFPAERADTAGWVPAKLFEYLSTDLPIVYLADPATEGARLLREQPGCFVVAPTDPSGISAALRAALGGGRYPRDQRILSRRSRTATLAAVLDDAVAPR